MGWLVVGYKPLSSVPASGPICVLRINKLGLTQRKLWMHFEEKGKIYISQENDEGKVVSNKLYRAIYQK